jgi:hypothetical protein
MLRRQSFISHHERLDVKASSPRDFSVTIRNTWRRQDQPELKVELLRYMNECTTIEES